MCSPISTESAINLSLPLDKHGMNLVCLFSAELTFSFTVPEVLVVRVPKVHTHRSFGGHYNSVRKVLMRYHSWAKQRICRPY